MDGVLSLQHAGLCSRTVAQSPHSWLEVAGGETTPTSALILHLWLHLANQPRLVLVWVGVAAKQINSKDLQICSTEMRWVDQQSGNLSPCSLYMGSNMSLLSLLL